MAKTDKESIDKWRARLEERKKRRIKLPHGSEKSPSVQIHDEHRAYYLLVALFQLVFPAFLGGRFLNYHWDLQLNGYLLSAMIWTIVVIWWELWTRVFYDVHAARGAIMFNPLMGFKKLQSYELESKPDTARGMREAGHGLNGKWFFERSERVIDLTADVIFPRMTISGKTKDNIMFTAEAQISSKPLRGKLVNAYLNSKELVISTVQSDIDLAATWIISKYNALPTTDKAGNYIPGILERADEFRDELNDALYGGDGVIDPTELELGSYFGKILISNPALPAEIMRAIEAQKRVELLSNATQTFIDKEMTKEMASLMALKAQGLPTEGLNVETWRFEGLENLPRGLTHIGMDPYRGPRGPKPESGKKPDPGKKPPEAKK